MKIRTDRKIPKKWYQKKCKRCRHNIRRKYKYCSWCGYHLTHQGLNSVDIPEKDIDPEDINGVS